ncbi:hypothetical protein L0F63_000840, partial [Massospora cicadina]
MEPNVAIESTPQVWCESIQELCESLTYFRSYQSGLYASNGIAIALLLNADEVERECFNWDVIITHGSYLAAKPIAVILGPKVNKNVIRNKHPFSVLGWYTITHLWSEYDLGLTKGESKRKYFVRKKIRLQHIPQQPYKKWWQLDACPVHVDREFLHLHCRCQTRLCKQCDKISPLVYEDGFICMNEECQRFWMLSSREEWFGWSCRSCKVWKQFDFGPLGLSDVLDPFERVYTGFRVENGLLFINPESGIQLAERINKNNQTSLHYYLPNLGEITHFLGKTTLLEASPPPIKEALEFIEERISHNNFNQVSSLLYMQGQRMDWHDDGEEVVVGP